MSLSRLEITGFKSFMSRLNIEFSSGITSIIGPNGCGKTNIVDAIRWVLGEQKTRLLRNTKMENVIFNGTRQRKSLGMAEVSISLTNDDRSIPLDYSEVTISRKIHRSGHSEYYVNGELTRLKTIKGLLVDTGLGSHAYSIIEREMVDSVLSEKEQDKRFLFEEAAGIMKYRLQREEALRKIKHTETDLVRLGDILSELEKEIRSLRYQMGKARHYTRLKEKIDKMEAALLKCTLHELLGKREELEKELERHKGITLTDENEISVLENRLQELRIRSSELERKLQAQHEQRYTVSQSIKGNEEKIAVNAERITTNRARIEEDQEEIEKARLKLESSRRDILLHRTAFSSKEEALEKLRADITEHEQALSSLTGQLKAAKDELRDKKQIALDFMEEQARVKGLREHLEKNLADLEEKRSGLEHQIGLLKSDEANHRSQLSEVITKSDEQHHSTAQLEELRSSLGARQDRAGEVAAQCEDLHSEVVRWLGGMKEKLAFLETIKQEHQQSREDVLSKGRFRGVLADFVKVSKEHRTCFEACLSPLLRGLLAESKSAALDCIDNLKSNGGGRVQILYPDGGGPAEAAIDGAGVIGSALSLIQCEESISDYLASYLSDVVVVEDVDTALSQLESGRAGRVATLDGVFFDGPGRIVVSGAEEVEPTILEYQTKISELENSIRTAEGRAEVLEARKKRLAGLRRRYIDDNARIRTDLVNARQHEEKTAAEQRTIEIDLARTKEKITGLAASLEEVQVSIGDLKLKLTCREEVSPGGSVRAESNGGELNQLEDRVVSVEREREAVLETSSRLKLEEATIAGEVATLQARLRNTAELDTELNALITAREEDIKRCNVQIAVGEDETDILKETIAGFHTEKETIENDIEAANKSYEEYDRTGTELETELKEIKFRRDQKKENVHRYTVELAALGERVSSLLEKGRDNFNQDLSGYLDGRDTFDPVEWEDLDRDALAVLKEKLEHIGPVNMLAVDEYETKKERFIFLSRQKKDLDEARESLLLAIRRINKEARKILSETFEIVRENFKKTFLTLFGGGEADLLFVGSDDPLEATIKIVANPKGKRLHDISSLSGGERALTALSLLFAIYLVKPSQFCIFDEVDAPLDDANIGRFIQMLRSFADKTQFIVITHNKKTMEAADYLYGITMEEPGVSTLISVQFADVDRFRTKRTIRKPAATTSGAEKTEAEVPVSA